MIGAGNEFGGRPKGPRREPDMQATVTHSRIGFETPDQHRSLIDRFWDDVAPFNNYSPEAARALLERQAHLSGEPLASDPWAAVQAALTERAAGRKIIRTA